MPEGFKNSVRDFVEVSAEDGYVNLYTADGDEIRVHVGKRVAQELVDAIQEALGTWNGWAN